MSIPKGQFGNRLDTAAGRAKEAQMAAAAQALVVAHSEAVHGRPEAASIALQTAQQTAAAIPNAPAAFTQAVTRDVGNIQQLIPTNTSPPPTSPPPSGGGGGGGASIGNSGSHHPTAPQPAAPPPTPPSPWVTTPTFTQPPGIKQADPDIIIGPETDTTGDYIVERFFEELGGTELINLSRYDLIDGADVSYRPIANLSRLRRRFNPNNIIALDILSDNEFSKFSINLLSRGMNEPYFDDDGNLVVEVDIIRPEENIEVEISLSGTVTRIEL